MGEHYLSLPEKDRDEILYFLGAYEDHLTRLTDEIGPHPLVADHQRRVLYLMTRVRDL
jgi:hypothetical protein